MPSIYFSYVHSLKKKKKKYLFEEDPGEANGEGGSIWVEISSQPAAVAVAMTDIIVHKPADCPPTTTETSRAQNAGPIISKTRSVESDGSGNKIRIPALPMQPGLSPKRPRSTKTRLKPLKMSVKEYFKDEQIALKERLSSTNLSDMKTTFISEQKANSDEN